MQALQELHVAYEGKLFGNFLLPIYLKLTEHHRLKVIDQLERYYNRELDEPPQMTWRLARFLGCFKVLADGGFDGENISYPHFNVVVTP